MPSTKNPFGDKTRAECWYADIFSLPHHESKVYARMSMHKRAAQFAPFAALSTYHESLSEQSRYIEAFNELNADELEQLNSTLQRLLLHKGEQINVMVKHFVPDDKKVGGRYVETRGLLVDCNANKRILTIKVEGQLSNIQLCYVVGLKQVWNILTRDEYNKKAHDVFLHREPFTFNVLMLVVI